MLICAAMQFYGSPPAHGRLLQVRTRTISLAEFEFGIPRECSCERNSHPLAPSYSERNETNERAVLLLLAMLQIMTASAFKSKELLSSHAEAGTLYTTRASARAEDKQLKEQHQQRATAATKMYPRILARALNFPAMHFFASSKPNLTVADFWYYSIYVDP